MLTAINTKILLTILAALTVIGGAVLYQRDQATKAAEAAAKAAKILQLQRDDAEYLKQEDEDLSQAGRSGEEAAQFGRSSRRQDVEDVLALRINI